MLNIEENITKVIKTKKEANEFVKFLDKLSNSTHTTADFIVKKYLSDTYGEIKPGWSDMLEKDLDGSLDEEKSMKNIRKKIDYYKNKIKNAKIVKIEISFEPSKKFIEEIYALLSTSDSVSSLDGDGKKDFLIDAVVDNSIEKGARLYLDGKYINLSLGDYVSNCLVSEDVINRYL